MVIVFLTMVAIPEKQDEIMQTLIAMIDSMDKEKGCRQFQVFRDIMDAASFSSISEWETHEALSLYLQSDKFGVLLGMKSLVSRPLEILIQTVSRTEGIAFVNTVRSGQVLLR